MRTKATILSFVLVFAAYLLYGFALVPLVLPDSTGHNQVTNLSIAELPNPTREEIAPFLELFPEDGWERDPKKDIHLLRFGQTIVLFGEDDIEGKLLRLKPCTILLLPDDLQEYSGEEELQNKIRQSVVLRTPQGAEIQFDRNFDIGKLPLPNIETCRLWGKVTVQSSRENSGQQDDFYLETENVEIREEPGVTTIEALRDVRFTFGPHSGVGTGLTLQIASTDLSQPQAPNEMTSARFNRLQSLNLAFPEASGTTKIDVTCRGNFLFTANPAEQGWTASFYQAVDMVRNNPDKTVDRLTAEEVHLTLTATDSIAAPANKKSQFDRLEPALFVAQGKVGQNGQPPIPAKLSIKQNNDVTLVGDEIYLDLRKNFMSLSTREGAGASSHVEIIVADQYTIKSERSVQYTLGPNGAFGTFNAEGKGSMVGRVGDGAAVKNIALSWNKMQMVSHPAVKDQVVLYLTGGITAKMTGFGTMTANQLELHGTFNPANKSGSKSNLMLDHAVVKENVLFETDSGTCRVKQLTILFSNIMPDGRMLHSKWMPQVLTEKPPTAPTHTSQTLIQQVLTQQAIAAQPIQQVQHLEALSPLSPMQPTQQPTQQAMQPMPLYTPSNAPIAAPVISNPRSPNSQSARPTAPRGSVETQNLLGIKSSPSGGKFEMTGDSMRMQVVVHNGQSSAEIVAFEGNVKLRENLANNVASSGTSTAVEIAGDTVTIWNPADLTTKINITRQTNSNDAIFKGKGIELFARELNISRADNMFWSPGAGRLIAHTAAINAPGIPVGSGANDSRLVVEWNREMSCNGRVLLFSGERDTNNNRVKVAYQTQMLWCNEMQITLNRQVMFFDDQSSIEPKAVEIACFHDVYVQNQQLDAQGKRKSMDSAKFAKLWYYVEKNYIVGEGPGELNSVFLGSGQGFDLGNNLAGTPGNNAERLNFLAVCFQDKMQGSLLGNTKKVEFLGRKVTSAYCPVNGWDDKIDINNNLAAARRTGYTLECERLELEEIPNPANPSQSSMELTASGTAIIEGSGIFGRARTIKYNQAKSTVDMDGNVTIQITTPGQNARHAAGAIRYNIETRAIELIQAQGIGIH